MKVFYIKNKKSQCFITVCVWSAGGAKQHHSSLGTSLQLKKKIPDIEKSKYAHNSKTLLFWGCDGYRLINIKGQIRRRQPDRFPSSCLLLLLNLRHPTFSGSGGPQLSGQQIPFTSPHSHLCISNFSDHCAIVRKNRLVAYF